MKAGLHCNKNSDMAMWGLGWPFFSLLFSSFWFWKTEKRNWQKFHVCVWHESLTYELSSYNSMNWKFVQKTKNWVFIQIWMENSRMKIRLKSRGSKRKVPWNCTLNSVGCWMRGIFHIAGAITFTVRMQLLICAIYKCNFYKGVRLEKNYLYRVSILIDLKKWLLTDLRVIRNNPQSSSITL